MTASENPTSAEGLLDSITGLLNAAKAYLANENYDQAFRLLGPKLSRLHDLAHQLEIVEQGRERTRSHPVFEMCQLDPYTERAYTKPRGYAGDAVMMDYVYAGIPPSTTDATGQGIFRCTTRGPMGLSVLYRRALLSSYINDAIARNPAARILSVASGHCRELDGTLAMSEYFKGEVIAFDQDPESCAEVAKTYGKCANAVVGNVKTLIAGQLDLGHFNLIYSAGLFDYLPTTVAEKLCKILTGMLAPEGKLLVGNFTRGSYGRGYLDWLMDWQLIYRTEIELHALLGHNPAFQSKVFSDSHDNVAYAVLSTK